MKKLIIIKVVVLVLVGLILTATSCKTTGYGCKGKSKSITGY
jgi:hypothetical protein